eukprot:CAMPEP_0116067466 /NCGR_PEP_ID=MMETSP0322-20121206/11041_1 /TAXON_ID=163516 /ORGANISM="Leptocylindrus danicus var. apora, Strain B651" /LENGTH=679 /DNA_ID=CAMNT_0003554309 /DNA_START=215 /DNA_END=2251 /DNA_ORIENTATION=+
MSTSEVIECQQRMGFDHHPNNRMNGMLLAEEDVGVVKNIQNVAEFTKKADKLLPPVTGREDESCEGMSCSFRTPVTDDDDDSTKEDEKGLDSLRDSNTAVMVPHLMESVSEDDSWDGKIEEKLTEQSEEEKLCTLPPTGSPLILHRNSSTLRIMPTRNMKLSPYRFLPNLAARKHFLPNESTKESYRHVPDTFEEGGVEGQTKQNILPSEPQTESNLRVTNSFEEKEEEEERNIDDLTSEQKERLAAGLHPDGNGTNSCNDSCEYYRVPHMMQITREISDDTPVAVTPDGEVIYTYVDSPISYTSYDDSSLPSMSTFRTDGISGGRCAETVRIANGSVKQYVNYDAENLIGFDGVGDFDVDEFDVVTTKNAAHKYFESGNYDKALLRFEELLKMHMLQEGYHHGSVATDFHNIATCHIRLGRFGKAQPIIEEAIRLKMAFYGNNDVEVADSLHKLGIVFVSKNNFGSALQTFHRALRIYRSASELSQISEIIFKIGCIHFQINEFMAALMAFEEAMDIEQSLHIDGKPTDGRAEILCHLAFVKIKLKQYGDAIIFLEEALSIKQANYGRLHVDTLRVLDSIAFAYSQVDDLEKSMETYKTMVEVQANVFGPKSGSKTLSKMSLVLERMKDLEGALSCRHKVLALQENKLGPNHPTTQKTRAYIEKLSLLLEQQERAKNW